MELAQQVCEGIVVGRANIDPNDFRDFDNMMMLQQTKVQTRAHDLAEDVESLSLMQDQELPTARVRRLAQSLQRALEQSGDRQSRRARTLHQRVTARYFGICHEEVHNEVHELDAVLIVYDDNREGSEQSHLEAEDRGWVEEWWRRLTAALFPLDKLRGLRPNEKVDGSTQGHEADPIDLDTPTWPEEALDDRDLHDLRLQEEDARAEEEGLLRLVEEYEEQQKASAAKREDDKAMEAALNAPRIKQPRLQIDVQVTSGSSSSSSTRVR